MALAILETLQREDLPEEVLVDENLAITLPRRLGLSRVIYAQVERYREEVRRGRRVPEAEVADLFRLIARRPDAERVFLEVGRSLGSGVGAGWGRVLPRRLALGRARRRSVKLLRGLFGRGSVRSPRKEACIIGNTDLFCRADPSGSACALVTGIIEGVGKASVRVPIRVKQAGCAARGEAACTWQLEERRPEIVAPEASSPDGSGSPGHEELGDEPHDAAADSPGVPIPPEDGEALSA